MEPDQLKNWLSLLLTIAWLLPLGGFALEIFAGFWSTRLKKTAAYIAVGCIGAGFVCSLTALCSWGMHTGYWAEHDYLTKFFQETPLGGDHAPADGHAADGHHGSEHDAHHDEHSAHGAEHGAHGHEHDESKYPTVFAGRYYQLAEFGSLQLEIGYYIDSLTLVMFTMVTLIATCIHVFAIGYMSDELTEDYVDHFVHVGEGHLHRPGRFYRFFAFLSLFSFSMLGLVIAGNVFMVFIFWELVGICSYLLIGFYTERKSASTAANKAFIVNRVGDFGFLIGLMILWTSFGTFAFSEPSAEKAAENPGLFQMLRDDHGQMTVEIADDGSHQVVLTGPEGTHKTIPYYLLVAAGIGIFCGCVGKSAQFPLQTWLPDAMEGPTPVSALVHSATMVAAGVYLVGRFYPMFTPEVLVTIAYIGAITLFMAATIAVVATDIKRVLAYSTISQLGYMMLSLGVGGWVAGLLHLITHAFFKSLMFLCSGSVIHGCHHEQEMPKMGGLRKKMPITAYTMLIGVIAITGLAIPGTYFGFQFAMSGYHSKDAIVATSLAYWGLNDQHVLLFILPLAGAGITAFYMFRLWFYTFAGEPRDQHIHDHAHESPAVMWVPLVILSFFAIFCAYDGEQGPLWGLLVHSEPAGMDHGFDPAAPGQIAVPGHHHVHEKMSGDATVHDVAGRYALAVAIAGAILAYLFYGARLLNPADVRRQVAGLHEFLVEKWRFDELYDAMFVKPVHVISGWIAALDRVVIDGFLHGTSKAAVDVSTWDRRFDEQVIDGLVNWVGDRTFRVGRSLRFVQTGRLRQYVMFIAGGLFGVLMLVYILTL